MGQSHTAAVIVRRPRWRAYLLLARVSNLPTIWTNVLAGMVASQAAFELPIFVRTAVAVSLFYSGGMFLNDAFDAEHDRRFRPERPVPSGDLTRREVFLIGASLLVVGEVMLEPSLPGFLLGGALAGAIVAYDYGHKGNHVAPLIMGACRGLVYCVAAAVAGALPGFVIASALVMGLYVSALTLVAKLAGASARWLVPLLIAAISLVDAGVIAWASRSVALTVAAASGFLLTLFLQRYVPGD